MVVGYLIITMFCVVVVGVRYSLVVKEQREEIECLEINQKMLMLEKENFLEEIERLNKKTIKSENKKILKSEKANKAMRTCPECGGEMLMLEKENFLEEIERLNKKTIKSENKKILKSEKANKAMRTCPECGGEGNSVGCWFYSEESVYGRFECGCGCLWECNSKDF